MCESHNSDENSVELNEIPDIFFWIIGLKCFLNCLSVFHLVLYSLQSNTRYFVNHLERSTYHYIFDKVVMGGNPIILTKIPLNYMKFHIYFYFSLFSLLSVYTILFHFH